MCPSLVGRLGAWENTWSPYDFSFHHSPTSSVEAHDSSVFTDSSHSPGSPDTDVSTTPAKQLSFTEAATVTDNWTIASGRLAWKRPLWLPRDGRELALKAAFRAFPLTQDDVRHVPVPPLESVHITWRNIGRPGGFCRPVAIVDVTRPANICTRQPRTKKIFLDYHKVSRALPPVQRTLIVFTKRRSCDGPIESIAASSNEASLPEPDSSVPQSSERPAKRPKLSVKTGNVSRRIKVESELALAEETDSKLANVSLDGQASVVEDLISDENIKIEPE
ncbi:hypothetical protein F503_06031 [Ophiostoma piceae UAMH 11346]|uniref:Uncharacterized protein n=1 Tax=Ophiostoma piceae (strain UAMH 11346) TaxID=1262450 RepID=S3CFL1_OPHP1|nr:hypothetical protein F503_06031 [Ophiostoma piceae UAMH 11346]